MQKRSGWPKLGSVLVWTAAGVLTLLLPFVAFWPMLDVPPFEHHSILLFEHGAQNGLDDIFVVGHAAGLRILAFYTFVLHVKTTGFAMVPVQVFNVASIALALFASGVYARALTGRTELLLIVPLLFFPCFIWWQTVEWTPGRQETLVLIFSAFALALYHARAEPGWGTVGAVAALLIASGLSKETGMVAMVYVGALAVLDPRRRRYLWAGIGAFALVFALRQILLVHPYSEPGVIKCEDMSFLAGWSRTCVTTDFLDLQNVAQIAWNVFLGIYLSVVPLIFDQHVPHAFQDTIGFFQPERFGAGYLAYAALCLAAFAAATIANWRVVLAAMILVVLNAVILAAFWRLRNMGIGMLGGLTVLGFGLAVMAHAAFGFVRERIWRDRLGTAAVAALVAALVWLNGPQVERFHRASAQHADYRRDGGTELACGESRKVLVRERRYDPDYDIDRSAVDAVLRAWGVDPAACDFPERLPAVEPVGRG